MYDGQLRRLNVIKADSRDGEARLSSKTYEIQVLIPVDCAVRANKLLLSAKRPPATHWESEGNCNEKA
jgi:hypothetical protein